MQLAFYFHSLHIILQKKKTLKETWAVKIKRAATIQATEKTVNLRSLVFIHMKLHMASTLTKIYCSAYIKE